MADGDNFKKIPEGPVVKISVIDTGIGLDSEDLKRIFSPFEQVDSSTSRKYHGTGLGLSLTRRLIQLHNGWIYASSKGIGQGSTFSFLLPAIQEEQKNL